MSLRRAIAAVVALWLGTEWLFECEARSADVQFARDIRPLLSANCFECHGPDEAHRQANLRLDQREGLSAANASGPIVAPGQPQESVLFQRITAAGADRMPPPESGLELSPQQIELIRDWIDSGAAWQPHWSFVPAVRPPLPPVVDGPWPENSIDRYILARLEEQAIRPSPAADRETLIRRVSLDLTGLPPTLEEIDRYLADDAPNAYERLVDRLLASPRYGERMAAVWLDAARYADTYGYQDDGELSMWRWRDWVISAFNNNMPFDQFTVEQIAGDLLPNPTLEQRIATGFNRNHRHNSEGGIIPEEFRVEYVADRVDTTATVWLGLTMVCARCHDHKYDPISQREYYQLFAFFNNIDEDGRAYKSGNTPPWIVAPTQSEFDRQTHLEQQIEVASNDLAELEPEISQAQSNWEESYLGTSHGKVAVTRALEAAFEFDGNLLDSARQATSEEVQRTAGATSFTPGQFGQALQFDGKTRIDLGTNIGNFSDDKRFSISIWIKPTDANGAVYAKLEDFENLKSEGYEIQLRDGRLRVHLVEHWDDSAIRVETTQAVHLDHWTHVAITYDGMRRADGVQVYFDGTPQTLTAEIDSLYQGFSNDSPVRIGQRHGEESAFRGALDELRIYRDVLTPAEVALLAVPETIDEILGVAVDDRSARQAAAARTYFLQNHAQGRIHDLYFQRQRLQQELQTLKLGFPTVMVMQERAERRPTFVLARGQYDAPAAEVQPDVPAALGLMPPRLARNRLGLARWLVQPHHPLTARVIANRLWQMSFGSGLVRTAEDFGAQGEPPSHPKLLDWLATELVRTNWDIKQLRRTIVTSATYRQSSRAREELSAIDPANRWLARGPRFRLPAEMVRDQALLASGQLVEELGGPSVCIRQPPGLWAEISDDTYVQGEGEALYRRSLYAFWKRTVPHPLLMAFDAVDRETCIVREGRTNTPIQALVLMNEPGFVEAACAMARRALSQSGPSRQQVLPLLFRLATGRTARPAELQLLAASYERHLQHFNARPNEAEKLFSTVDHKLTDDLPLADLAAYTAVANTLLNLDEVITQH